VEMVVRPRRMPEAGQAGGRRRETFVDVQHRLANPMNTHVVLHISGRRKWSDWSRISTPGGCGPNYPPGGAERRCR